MPEIDVHFAPPLEVEDTSLAARLLASAMAFARTVDPQAPIALGRINIIVLLRVQDATLEDDEAFAPLVGRPQQGQHGIW